MRNLWVFAVSFLLACSVVLAGCSGGGSLSDGGGSPSASENGKTDGSPSPKKDPVEITWMVTTNPYKEQWYDSTIKAFEETHPYIKVKLMLVPLADVPQKLQTMMASKTVPDVWSANWGGGFMQWYTKDLLLDLTPYIEKDPQIFDGIDPKVAEMYKIDGKTYGIPLFSTGTYLFYNKEMFDEANLPYPPTDWDDKSWNWETFVETAKALTKTEGNKKRYGFFINAPIEERVWLFGGDFFKPETYTTGVIDEPVILENPRNEVGLQRHIELIHTHKVMPTQAEADAALQVGDPFLSQTVAMMANGGWGFQNYSQGAKFKWGVAAMPWTDSETRAVAMYVDPWNIYKGSKHPDEAWEFIKFITDPQGAGGDYSLKTGAMPIHDSLLADWKKNISEKTGMTEAELDQVLSGSIKYGREAINHMIQNWTPIGNAFKQIATGAYNGTKSAREALEEMDREVRKLIRE